MIVIALQSGSNGNCIYVESDGTQFLFDAGISGARAEDRLAEFGRDIRDVDALIISHDHNDHIRCAGIYQRKYGLPIYVSKRTFRAARRRTKLGRLSDVRHFVPGDSIIVDGVAVHSVPTPHDGAEGSAFVIEGEGRRVGVLTDLGCVFDGLPDVVHSLDAVMLESNYDPTMLDRGPYPRDLKRGIGGPGGHLSNVEAAELLRDAAGPGLRWACLAHLSEQNNAPGLALETHAEILSGSVPLFVASRYEPTVLPAV